MDRRDFIKTTAVTGIAGACASMTETSGYAAPDGGIMKREYGNTGIHLSIIGFGGIVVSGVEQSHADTVVAEAFERGINYYDVAPTYGNAEDRLGPALEPYRDRVFLACKTTERTKEGSEKELHASLKKLRTNHFDLYQLHAMTTIEDVETVFAPDGAMETFVKAREKGLIRHIGFSAHSAEAAIALMDRFDFDSLLFPFNYVCWYQGNFGPQVLAKAKEKNTACLALKAMAKTRWPEDANRKAYPKCWYQPLTDKREASLALRFTLSKGVTAAIPPGEESLFRMALSIAEEGIRLSGGEKERIHGMSKGVNPIFNALA